MFHLIINSLLAGIGLSLCSGPIGCFMLWQRMSYFADSLSHSILLGVMLGLLIGISPLIGGVIIAIVIAYILNILNANHNNDSLLGIISQSCLAISIIINSFSKNFLMNMNYYLFGDILAINYIDIIELFILALCVYGWLLARWKKILLIIISKELAYADNISVNKIKFELVLMIALVIALSIKIVGILLISSMLIIPASSARLISLTPKQMIIYSIIIGIISNIFGIVISSIIDIPTGASIVITSLIIFTIICSRNYFQSHRKII